MKKCICIIIILIMVCSLTACGNRMKEAFETSMEPLPELDENVCDGYSRTLTVYGKDDCVLKVCGGYMPCNKRFNEMYQIVNECYPKEELSALYDAWIEALKKENNF